MMLKAVWSLANRIVLVALYPEEYNSMDVLQTSESTSAGKEIVGEKNGA